MSRMLSCIVLYFWRAHQAPMFFFFAITSCDSLRCNRLKSLLIGQAAKQSRLLRRFETRFLLCVECRSFAAWFSSSLLSSFRSWSLWIVLCETVAFRERHYNNWSTVLVGFVFNRNSSDIWLVAQIECLVQVWPAPLWRRVRPSSEQCSCQMLRLFAAALRKSAFQGEVARAWRIKKRAGYDVS